MNKSKLKDFAINTGITVFMLGIVWPTVEHYMNKFLNGKTEENKKKQDSPPTTL